MKLLSKSNTRKKKTMNIEMKNGSHAYRFSSTNKFYHNRRFASLGEAKREADRLCPKYANIDVWALFDNNVERLIYTPAGNTGGQARRGSYTK